MEEQKQVPMFSEESNEIIKKNFKGRERLLMNMRALMLGLELTDEEKDEIAAVFADEAVFKAVRERFFPEMSKDAPLGTNMDMWLGAEKMIFAQPKDTIQQAFEYKKKSIEMTEKALEGLRNPHEYSVDLSVDDLDKNVVDPLHVKLLSRNQFIRHVESQLMFIKVVSEQEPITSEQKAEMKAKNSTK